MKLKIQDSLPSVTLMCIVVHLVCAFEAGKIEGEEKKVEYVREIYKYYKPISQEYIPPLKRF